ncbi:MAG: choice-of-anchor D domain-containing protein, partial [Terracidiphilus sp.]
MLRFRVRSFSLIHGAFAAPFLRAAGVLLVVSGLAFGSPASAQTASFSYAITALGGGFTHPNDVAVDSGGNIYVADTNNSAVKEMPAGCASSSCVTTLGGGFSSPNGVAVDGSGNVYVADTSNSAVKEMPAGCASSSCVTTLGGGFFFPYGVAVDGSGNVYVAEPLSNAVVEMPAGCASSSCVTALGGGFEGPNSVAVDGSGNVYVSESLYTSEVVYNEVNEMPSGCTSSSCVTTLGGGFSGPTGVAVDGSGNVYVADAGNNAVKEMPAGCATSSCVTVLGGGFYDPQGVAVDGSGNVYVADSNNNAVKEIMTRAADLFTVPVKTASAALTLTFTFNSAGSLSSTTPYQVLTQGATNLDFKAAATQETNACNGTTSYTTGETCTVDVTLKPAAPGVRSGAVELLGSSNNLIATGYVWGVGSGPQVTFPGAEPATYVSGLNVPLGMAVDAAGDLLIANSYGPNVWLVAPDGSTQTKGSGFVMPTAVAIDGAGNIFIADNDAVVYEIGKVSNAQTQLNIPGLTDPEYLSVDGAGNLYISEPSAHTVLKVTPSGAQSTVGTGLSDPRGTTEDGAGNVYIIDYSEGAVITVPPTGSQTAVYGLGGPTGVAVDPAGDIYVADFGNGILILITPSGAVSTIDGNAFEGPWDAGMDGSGNLYVTDYIAGVVRKIDLADPPALNFAATPVGLTSSDSPQTVMLTNSGNAPLTFPNPSAGNDPSISTNFLLNSGVGSDCPLVTSSSAAGTLAAGASCLLPVSFKPTTTGSFNGALTLTDNSLNAASPNYASQSIELSGTGTPDSPTVTSVSPIAPQQTQTITISGSGFGTQSAYDGDSNYILFADPAGTPPWYAGNASNPVTLSVSSWSDTQIVITGFTGQYGTDGMCISPGDQLYIKVWNTQTGNGP